mgnify:CR=1 FL=1
MRQSPPQPISTTVNSTTFDLAAASGATGSLGGHVTDGLGNPVVRVRMKIYDATNGAFAMRTRTDLILQLGWSSVMPVLAATATSFVVAFLFAFQVIS